jgi:hypothetical protein
MTKMIRAAALALVLSVCARAGDGIMQADKALAPPPPPAITAQPTEEATEAAGGETDTGAAETAAELARALLRSLMAIF